MSLYTAQGLFALHILWCNQMMSLFRLLQNTEVQLLASYQPLVYREPNYGFLTCTLHMLF